MKGYMQIEVPRACNGLGAGEKDCPNKKTCPVYTELFDDNDKTYEEWERLTCMHRPPNCPILTKTDITPAWMYKLEFTATILRAIMGIAVCIMLVCLLASIAHGGWYKVSMWALAVVVLSIVLMVILAGIGAHLQNLEEEDKEK